MREEMFSIQATGQPVLVYGLIKTHEKGCHSKLCLHGHTNLNRNKNTWCV